MELTLIIIALTLACIAGFEFFYLMYVDAINRQQKRRIRQLEKQLAKMRGELDSIQTLFEEMPEPEQELWPEVIDDDRVL
jgi:Tfp pilus assembly protein PilN